MTYQAIRVETKDGVTLLTLNRPERFNALNRQMIGEILDVLAKAKPGSDTRTIVITGAGRGFCGGADLKDPAGPAGLEQAAGGGGGAGQGAQDIAPMAVGPEDRDQGQGGQPAGAAGLQEAEGELQGQREAQVGEEVRSGIEERLALGRQAAPEAGPQATPPRPPAGPRPSGGSRPGEGPRRPGPPCRSGRGRGPPGLPPARGGRRRPRPATRG